MDTLVCPLIEVKFDTSAPSTMRFSGYGAVFGNIDSYGDVIQKGAFTKFLEDAKSGAQPWPAMLSQHGGWGLTAEDMTPIGAWLKLSEDDYGLKVEGDLAPTIRGTEYYQLMKMEPRPAIDGLSIGYIAKEYEPRSKPEDPKRLLKRIDLIEISPVTRPANRKARVSGVKASDMSEREFERLLMQDAGLTRSEARVVINHGFKSLSKQDAGSQELGELAAIIRRNLAST